MSIARKTFAVAVPLVALLAAGCAAPKTIDFCEIERPARPAELDAYDVFVGSWDWKAEMVNAVDADKEWTGTAEWKWLLDDRYLHGLMSAKCAHAEFQAAGVWSWHPKSKKYKWWMFNNWGYPQEGKAKYCAETKTWTMPYKSVGLDGTTSYGEYTMQVVDKDTLDWTMVEWADALRMIKKSEMTGVYTRRR